MKHALALSALAFGLILGSAGAARADVAPPNSSECDTKNPGDACTDDSGKAGVCTSSTCSKLDYSQTPPQTVTYACTLCDATDGGASGGTAGSTSGSGSSGSGGCSMAPAGASEGWWLAAALALPLLRRRRGR